MLPDVPVPSIDRRPATLTKTLPALPEPKVLPAICPALVRDRLPAATLSVPALPLLPASVPEVMPVKAFWIDSEPATVTDTAPLLPEPTVSLAIIAPLARD